MVSNLKLIHQLEVYHAAMMIKIYYFWHWMPITEQEIYLNPVCGVHHRDFSNIFQDLETIFCSAD